MIKRKMTNSVKGSNRKLLYKQVPTKTGIKIEINLSQVVSTLTLKVTIRWEAIKFLREGNFHRENRANAIYQETNKTNRRTHSEASQMKVKKVNSEDDLS